MAVAANHTLAQGAFGKVYREWYNGQWAAIKKVPLEAVRRRDLEREYHVYLEAVHPNIVRILGPITIEHQKYVIPLEFIFGEELETTIFHRHKSKIHLTPAVRCEVTAGMCDGLWYLHSKDIVHQDLKPDNIMVEHGTNRAVIIDLGLAKFFKHGLNSAMNLGNVAYSAPEVLQGFQRDQRSDVWAMGKVMAELRLLRRLHTHEVNGASISHLLRESSYCGLVASMVRTDPNHRATMAHVVRAVRRC